MKIRNWRTGGGYLRGVDVSSYQGTINYAKMKQNGIKFAILRAYGSSHGSGGDTKINEYARGFKSVDIPCGSYFFCTISNEYDLSSARSQANLYATKLEGAFGKGSWGQLTPFIDLENNANVGGRHTSLNTTQMLKWVDEFRKTFEARFENRVKLGIYTSWYFIHDHNNFNHGSGAGNILKDMPLWMAKWRTDNIKDVGGWTNWVLWQYTDDAQPFSSGQAVGVSSTGLDMNYVENLSDIMTTIVVDASKPVANLAQNNSIVVSWHKPSVSGITKIELWRDGKYYKTLDKNATKYTDIETEYGRKYYYQIKVFAGSTSDLSPISNEIKTLIPKSSAPTGLSVDSFDRSLKVSWNPNPVSDEVTGYTLFMDGDKVDFTQETSYEIKGLTNGRVYSFQLVAHNENPSPSNLSAKVTGTPIVDLPNVPVNLVASVRVNKEINLTWTYVPKEDFSHFQILLNNEVVADNIKETNYTFTGLNVNKTYNFQVVAFDLQGDSSSSEIKSSSINEPSKVLNLKGTPLDRAVELHWDIATFIPSEEVTQETTTNTLADVDNPPTEEVPLEAPTDPLPTVEPVAEITQEELEEAEKEASQEVPPSIPEYTLAPVPPPSPKPLPKYGMVSYNKLKENALALTSLYETSTSYPNNFGVTVGDFDGAGMSFGAIQYNIGSGTLQPIMKHLLTHHSSVVKTAFKYNSNRTYYNTIYDVFMRRSKSQQLSWARSITGGRNLKEPYKTYFRNLGVTQPSIDIQVKQAGWYFDQAKKAFDEFGLWSRRAFALLFDIFVQSGSISSTVKSNIKYDFGRIKTSGKTIQQIETEKLVIIANRRADAVSSTWRTVYRDRKLGIAKGSGWCYNNTLFMDTRKYDMILEPAFADNIPQEFQTNYQTEFAEEFHFDAQKYETEFAEEITTFNTTTEESNVDANVDTVEQNTDKIFVKKYLIYQDELLIDSVDGDTTTYRVEGLENNKIYNFSLQALSDQDIKGEVSDPVQLLPVYEYPNKAYDMKAEIIDLTTILFSWSHEKKDTFSHYEVYVNDKMVAQNSNLLEYTYLGAIANFDYKLEVVTVDNQGDRTSSGTILSRIDVPIPPTNVKVFPKDREAILTWDINKEPFVRQYKVYKDGVLHLVVNSPSNSHKIEGLQNDILYRFQVQAVGENGFTSDLSEEVSTTPKLDVPIAPKITYHKELGNGGVELVWEHTQKEYHSHYNVYKNGFLYAGNIKEKSYQTDYLESNTTHNFQIRAVDIQGDKSELSNSRYITIYATVLEPLSLSVGKIDESVQLIKPNLYLCKPDKTTVGKLNEASQITYLTRYADLNELTFRIPYNEEIRHELAKNPNFDNLKERYLIRLEFGKHIEYFIVNEITNTSDNNTKQVHAWSLGYELKDKNIRSFKEEIYTCSSAFHVALDGVLNWTIGANIQNEDFYWNQESRIFDVASKSVLDFIIEIATSFNAVLVWDTVNRVIDLENPTIEAENKGLKVTYGNYLKSLSKTSSVDEMVTQLIPIGENNLSIREVTVNGSDYLEDFTYFMEGFELEETDFTDFLLTSKAVVSDPTDTFYSDLGFTNVPIGAVFSTFDQNTNTLSNEIKSNNIAYGIVNMVKMYNSTMETKYIDRAKLLASFFINNQMDGDFYGQTFKYVPNRFEYDSATTNWKAEIDNVHLFDLYMVAWSLLELYPFDKNQEYKDLVDGLIKILSTASTSLNRRVDNYEIANGYKGLIYQNIRKLIHPVSVNETYTMDEDTALEVSVTNGVLKNATDEDSGVLHETLTAVLETSTSNGTLTLEEDGSFIYIPKLDFYGTDKFTYRVTDGYLYSNISTVTITVNNIPEVPVSQNEQYVLEEDSSLIIDSVNGVLKNATDKDSTNLTAILVSTTANGDLVLNSDGSFTYTPVANYYGIDTFTYKVSDGALESNVSTVTLVVYDVGELPIAYNNAYVMDEDTTLNVDVASGVLTDDVDVDSPVLTTILVSSTTNGQLTLNEDGSFEYIPNPNFYGTDSFIYKAFDGAYESNEATVTITINNVAETPIAYNDIYNMKEDTVLTIDSVNGVLKNDSDLDSTELTAILVETTLFGELTFNTDGSFVYTPNPNFEGLDSFMYKVSDGVLESEVALVQIEVENVPEIPVAYNDNYTVKEDSILRVKASNGLLTNDIDLDTPRTSLKTILVSSTTNGTLKLNSDGSFDYTPKANFYGTDTFTYKVSDGVHTSNNATVTITVTNTPERPNKPIITQPSNRFVSNTLVVKGSVSDPDSSQVKLIVEYCLSSNFSSSTVYKRESGYVSSGSIATVNFSGTAINKKFYCRARAYDGSLYSDYIYFDFIYAPQPSGTKIYTVKSGDTFSEIAEDYRISLSKLKSLNKWIANYNLIYVGQWVYVPSTAQYYGEFADEFYFDIDSFRTEMAEEITPNLTNIEAEPIYSYDFNKHVFDIPVVEVLKKTYSKYAEIFEIDETTPFLDLENYEYFHHEIILTTQQFLINQYENGNILMSPTGLPYHKYHYEEADPVVENLILNGYDNFDTIAIGDFPNTSIVDIDEKYALSGNNSLKIVARADHDNNGAWLGDSSNDFHIPVIAGQRYIFSFYAFAEKEATIQGHVNFNTAETQTLYSSPQQTIEAYKWTRIYFEVIPPSDATLALCRVDCDSFDTECWFDNLMLESAEVGQTLPSEFIPHGVSAYKPKPKNFNPIDQTYGDSYFDIKNVIQIVNGYALFNIENPAREMRDRIFNLKQDGLPTEILFYNKYNYDGSVTETERSTGNTGWFLVLDDTLGIEEYKKTLKDTILTYQIEQVGTNIDKAFYSRIGDTTSVIELSDVNLAVNPISSLEYFEVIHHSPYMSDNLCKAIFRYKRLLEQNEGKFQKLIDDKRLKGEELVELQYTLEEIETDLLIVQDRLNSLKAEQQLHYDNLNYDGTTKAVTYELHKDYKYVLMMKTDNVTNNVFNTPKEDYALVDENWNIIEKISFSRENETTVEASIDNYDYTILFDGVDSANYEIQINRILNEEFETEENEQALLDKYNEEIAQEEYDLQEAIVNSKEIEIANIETEMGTLQSELSIYNNFTNEQRKERDLYVISKEYVDERINNPEELKNRAIEKFKELINPVLTITIDIVNFLEVLEEHHHWHKLELGTIINIFYEKFDISIKAKIITIDYDFENKTISLTISNIKEIETNQEKFIKALYGAISTSNKVSLEKNSWSKGIEVKEEFDSFVNSEYDATKQKIIAGTNETVEISRRGLLIKSDVNPNSFLVANASVLAITNDSGKSYKNAITTDGVIAQRLIGEIIAGEELIIKNTAGNFRVDSKGVTIENQALNIIGGIRQDQLSEDISFDVDFSGLVATYVNTYDDNDENGVTPTSPSIIEDGTHVQHTNITNDLVDISFNWEFVDSNDSAGDIDGFMIYIYTSNSSGTYTFGNSPSKEITYYAKPNKRSIILENVPRNLYYNFGVEAYRSVKTQIDSRGVIKSPVIQTSTPYNPINHTAYTGDIIGTVNWGQEIRARADIITAIREGQSYDNVTIDSSNGLVVENNSQLVKTILNSDGFRIQTRKATTGIYEDSLIATTNGELIANDLIANRLIVNDSTNRVLIDAEKAQINFANFSVVTGNITADNIDLKGLQVINNTGTTTFAIDSNGNVTVSGNINMTGGNITWNTVSKPTYTATEIGARPADWTPTASEVGARPSNWIPTTTEVGAEPQMHTGTTPPTDTRKKWLDTNTDPAILKAYVNGIWIKATPTSATEVGARPSNWTPTANEVGARPDTWTPTATEVGARPSTWTPTASEVGAKAIDWLPTYTDVQGTKPPTNANNTFSELRYNTSILGFQYSNGTLFLNATHIKTGTLDVDTGIAIVSDQGGVVIDKSGVNVRNGTFTIEEANGVKFDLNKKTNLLIDHSFELMPIDLNSNPVTASTNIGYRYCDWTKMESKDAIYYQWGGVGNPIILSSRYSDMGNVSMIGNQNAVVNSTNYFQQAIFLENMTSKIFTFSAYVRRSQVNETTASYPQIEILQRSYDDMEWDIPHTSFVTQTWQTRPLMSDLERVSFTFDLSTVNPYEMLIRIKTDGAGYIEFDGCQLVNHDKPVLYETEQSVFDMRTGQDKYPSIIGGRHLDVSSIEKGYQFSPSFENGWINYGGGYNYASYWKDKDGMVHLTGLIKGGTTTSSITIFTLPFGFRPSGRQIFTTFCATANQNARIDVQADGTVSGQYLNASWTSLAGISFLASD